MQVKSKVASEAPPRLDLPQHFNGILAPNDDETPSENRE
jgi:hypothetical protein